ncbi:MAG: ABC transporter permease, partial [Lachnospiraceae bacterium]|nr:ABC transporter permease [Lachnospiraceae bacterium]
MTLSKIAVKNIRKSIKDYSIYFFTLVIGVIIFYVFNAIESQSIALSVSKRAYETIELMNQFLSSVSVFVAIVLGGLIIYASRFLIKRRNKEFGVYLT